MSSSRTSPRISSRTIRKEEECAMLPPRFEPRQNPQFVCDLFNQALKRFNIYGLINDSQWDGTTANYMQRTKTFTKVRFGFVSVLSGETIMSETTILKAGKERAAVETTTSK